MFENKKNVDNSELKTALDPIFKNQNPVLTAKNEIEISAVQTTSISKSIIPSPEWLIDKTIFFSGVNHDGRFLIFLFGFPVFLTLCSFNLLLHLAVYRFGNYYKNFIFPTDYYNISELYQDNGPRYVWRLKHEIKQFTPIIYFDILNDKSGNYQLDVDPSLLVFNFDRLCNIDDNRIKELIQPLLINSDVLSQYKDIQND